MEPKDIKLGDGKIFIQTKDTGIMQELANYEYKKENTDDAADAMQYAVSRYMGMTNGEMSLTLEIPKEKVRQILKLHGLERITRKRFKKLLMGCRIQRNDAETIVRTFGQNKIQYTPLAVQKVIETIITEMEKEGGI